MSVTKISGEITVYGWALNIAHKLPQVAILFTQDGLVTLLKKMPGATILPVECHCIPGQNLFHHIGGALVKENALICRYADVKIPD